MKEYEEDQLSRSIWALGLGKIPSLPPPQAKDMKHDLHLLALPLNTFPYSNEKRPNSYLLPQLSELEWSQLQVFRYGEYIRARVVFYRASHKNGNSPNTRAKRSIGLVYMALDTSLYKNSFLAAHSKSELQTNNSLHKPRKMASLETSRSAVHSS